jgi:V8-like Glu-specific endopeptidase
MNWFDGGASKKLSLVTGFTAALIPLHQASATPGKVLLPGQAAQAAAQAAPQIARNVSGMPVPQLANLPPELQGHSMNPVPPNDQPLPRVVAGVMGREDPRNLHEIVNASPLAGIEMQNGPVALDFGLGNQNTLYHYSDSLVDLSTVNQFPIRPTGWFTFTAADGGGFRCTAQLISRSVGVTAGHCVHQGGDEVGIPRDKGWVTNATFIPAYTNGTAPFGTAAVAYLTTTSGWYNTGALDQGYDVAVFTLAKRSGTEVEMGDYTGFYSFCWTDCLQSYWYNTQLGYPGNYYGGLYMTRGDHLEQSDSRDFVFGSGMEGWVQRGRPYIQPRLSRIERWLLRPVAVSQRRLRRDLMGLHRPDAEDSGRFVAVRAQQ